MIQEIKHIIDTSKRVYVASKSYRQQYEENKNRSIRFYNWWKEPYEQLWLYRFVKHRNIVPDGKVLNFVSVFGKREVTKLIDDGPIVFFSGENLHCAEHGAYTDYLLSDRTAKLGMGYDDMDDAHYLRFPLWIPFLFSPETDEQSLKARCEELRHPTIGKRDKFAALVARYDWSGTRTEIYEAIKHIGVIGCPSAIHHNDDDLKEKFGDNKIKYLAQFAFNICPENSNFYGYVTEKAFEAIAAGCIPIYWGSCGMPEPGMLNQDAIIHWNMGGDNADTIQLIEDLYSHPNRMREFMGQPRLKANAEEIVCSKINQLEKQLQEILR